MNRRLALLGLTTAAVSPLLTKAALAAPTPDPTTYVQDTLQVGGFSLTISKIALAKSGNPAVKTFADFEVIEQTAVGRALTSMPNPPPFVPTPTQAAQIAKLNAATTLFDYDYLSLEITGHLTLLTIQNALLTADTTLTDDHVHIALLAKSNIKQHLVLLRDLIYIYRL